MAILSTMSRAFLLPIALLPIAGVFLGIGALIASKTPELSAGWYIGSTIKAMGDVAFGNLPILFAMSVALAYSKESGIAGLTAVVGFLVMNAMQGALLTHHPKDGDIQAYYTLLFYNGSSEWLKVPEKLVTQNLGVTSLNTGVFAGIFVGALSAFSYNKFKEKKLPAGINFFEGKKLVPIVTFFMVIPLSFIFMLTWPIIGSGLAAFGTWTGTLPNGVDSFVFEIAERSLVPFGLHHVFYAPLWWTNAGGNIEEQLTAAGKLWDANALAILNKSWLPEFLSGEQLNYAQWVSQYLTMPKHANITAAMKPSEAMQTIIDFWKTQGLVGNDLLSAHGDQTMMYKVNGGLNLINYTLLENIGLNLGRFQSGKFGFMLLGLPMAGIAMWLTVPEENQKNVMGIYFSAAFTCFLTGITEPLEYSFLFLAPWLFYGVHMPLASISFLLAGALQTHVSMTVSGGIIDYIVFGIVPYFSGAMKWQSAFGILMVAVIMAPLYFFAFFFAVRYGKVEVPGREGAKLFTKDDVKSKKAAKDKKAAKADKLIAKEKAEENHTPIEEPIKVAVQKAVEEQVVVQKVEPKVEVVPVITEAAEPKVEAKKPVVTEKAEAKTEAKKPVAKKAPAKKAVVKKPVVKKPVAKKAEAKTEIDQAAQDLLKKYEKTLADKKPVDVAAHAKLDVKERAKVDGSAEITEPRSELQKHASALREQAKQAGVKLKTVNLRDMTKKEVIEFIKNTATKINSN
ncbi:PTS transporter subunit EIIC [Williamsoniiplasma lucivorax]